MGAARTVLPSLVVVAESSSAESIRDLFARRGFQVVLAPSLGAFTQYMTEGSVTPAAVLLDFAHPDAWFALQSIEDVRSRVVVLAIATEQQAAHAQRSIDAVFTRPVDPARLFVRVVELVAWKRGKRQRKLTGIVGVVDGNDLFRLVARELHRVVPPVNASAILERALRDLGSGPFVLGDADLEAMLASGRLAQALKPFGEHRAIMAAMGRISALLKGRAR